MPYLIIIALLGFSALFSGLTLGLLSLDSYELKRKMSLGDKDARTVYSIRIKGNFLLVTLTIGNITANSILAIFLGSITTGLLAVIISTGLITILGQILPQAVFSRHALSFGAKTVWLTRFFMFLFFPLSWPTAWLLDKLLGAELPTIYSKQELLKIIEEHGASKESDVATDEERIARGALTFGDKKIASVMTPRSVIFALNKYEKIDEKLLRTLKEAGYSRIVVYENSIDNVVGMLYAHQLIDRHVLGKTVNQVYDKKLYFVNENNTLDHVLNAFLKTKHHLFIVVNEFAEIVGVISLEDVLEIIIGKKIVDEFDQYDDMRKIAKYKARRGAVE